MSSLDAFNKKYGYGDGQINAVEAAPTGSSLDDFNRQLDEALIKTKEKSSTAVPATSVQHVVDIQNDLLQQSKERAWADHKKAKIGKLLQSIRDADFSAESINTATKNAAQYLGMDAKELSDTFSPAIAMNRKKVDKQNTLAAFSQMMKPYAHGGVVQPQIKPFSDVPIAKQMLPAAEAAGKMRPDSFEERIKQQIRDSGYRPEFIRAQFDKLIQSGYTRQQAMKVLRPAFNMAMKTEAARGQQSAAKAKRYDKAQKAVIPSAAAATGIATGAYALPTLIASAPALAAGATAAGQRLAQGAGDLLTRAGLTKLALDQAAAQAPAWQQAGLGAVKGGVEGLAAAEMYLRSEVAAGNITPEQASQIRPEVYKKFAAFSAGMGAAIPAASDLAAQIGARRTAGAPILSGKTEALKAAAETLQYGKPIGRAPMQVLQPLTPEQHEAVRRAASTIIGGRSTPLQRSVPRALKNVADVMRSQGAKQGYYQTYNQWANTAKSIEGATEVQAAAQNIPAVLTGKGKPPIPAQSAQTLGSIPSGPVIAMGGTVEATPVASVPKPAVQAHTRPQVEEKVSMVEQAPVRPVTGQAEGTGASVEGNNNVLGIQEVSPQEIQADPFRFQYKTGTGQGGATGLLHEVKKWQPELSGVMLVWKDPANGQTYIVNGHHRLDLAKRLNVPSVAVRYIDAATAEDARTIGAVANIAEGRGTAVDAAKVFRDADLSADDLQDMGVSLKEKMAADGLALSRLHPMLFGAVARGEMGTSTGVAIGNALSNHEDQIALVRLMEKSGKKLSAKEITELVSFVSNAAKQTQTEISLFGEEEAIQNLAVEKAQLAAYIKDRLSKDRRLFGYVAKTDRARELQRVGHIDADKSNQIASEAAKLEDVFSQQLHYAGPVSDALNQAAREMAVGGNINEIREGLYKRVRETLRAVFAGTEAEYYPTDKGTEGTGSVAAGQAGLFDGGEGGQLTPPQEIKQPALVSKAEPKPKEEVKPKPKPVKQPAVKQDKDVAKMVNVLKKRLESIGISNADAAVAKIAGVDSLDKIGWSETDNLVTAHDFLNVDRKAFLQKYGLKRVSKRGVEVHGETKEMPNDIDAFAGESTIDYPDTVEKENTADSRPIRASDIVKDLQAAFVPIRTGRFRLAETLGIYKSRGEVIRTRVTNDLPTIAHEVGHHLQKLFFQNKRGALKDSSIPKEFRAELKPLAYKGAKKQAVEGYAEFVRMYLTGPEKAKQAAPTFYQFFEAKLSEYPNIQKALSKAQEDIRLWKEQPSAARVRSTISRNEPDARRNVNASTLYTQWVDSLLPLEKAVEGIANGEKVPTAEDPFKEAWLGRGIAGKAETWLEYGTTDEAGKKTGKSLKEVLEPVINDLDAFFDYAISRHAMDVLDDGKTMPLRRKDYEAVVKAAPEHYGNVLKDLVDYQDSLLQELVNSGFLDEQSRVAMRKKWPHHVPLYRVIEGKSNPAALKRLKGSGRDIVDPLESIVGDTYRLLSLAQRNRVLLKLANMADKYEGSAAWIEKVDTPQYALRVKLSEVLNINKKDPVWLAIGQDPDDIANIFRPVYMPGKMEKLENVIAIWKGGRQQYYQLEPELYRTIMNIDAASANIVVDLLSTPTSWLRVGATTTLEFAFARNPIRDVMEAMIYSKHGFTPLDFFRGLFHVTGKTDLYYQWKATGGAHAALVSTDRKYLQASIRKIQHAKPIDGVINAVTHPIEALRALSEYLEEATRVGELSKELRGGKEDDINKILEAALNSRDVTLDFSRSGTAGRQVNRTIAFWNANVQDVDKFLRAFKTRPKQTLLRTLACITVPTILLYLKNRKDERYRRLPEWVKVTYFVVSTPKGLVCLPKPFLLGHVFSTMPETLIRYIDKEDPVAIDEFSRTVWDSISPGTIPTALTPIIDVWANRTFSGAPIVPEREKKLPKQMQYGPRTTSTAVLAGRILKQSPRQIDHLIRGYTGGLGGYAAQATGSALEALGAVKRPPRPAKLPSDYPLLKAFLPNEWASSSNMERFYKEKAILDIKTSVAKEGGLKMTRAEKAKAKKARRISTELSKLRKIQRAVEDSWKLAPKQKTRLLLKLKKAGEELVKEY